MSSDWKIAVHEAGHVLYARLSGGVVDWVNLNRSPPSTQAQVPTSKQLSHMMAGIAATELLGCSEAIDAFQIDRRNALEYALKLIQEACQDWETERAKVIAEALVAKALDTAKCLLGEHECALEQLARYLLENRTVFEEVNRVIDDLVRGGEE